MERLLTETEWRGLAHRFRFTPRELDVAKALLDEKEPSEIAVQLGITRESVATALDELFRKSGATSSVSFALRLFATIRSTPKPPTSRPMPKQ
jgi:DNA-binding CsgD family transcriptional regulator